MIKQADIIAYAWSQSEFTRREMMDFFRKQNLDFSKSTIASCLEALIHSGILKKIKRGVYSISEAKVKPFVPYYDKNMLDLESLIRSEFQFVRFCVWSCSDMKRYSHYVVNMNVVFVDVEREATESVFSFLLNAGLEQQVYLEPSQDVYTNYIYGKPSIVVRSLISEAPLVSYNRDSNRLSLEKLMVDVAIDDDFVFHHGYETLRFYRNVFDTSIVNESKLLRYAARRGCKEPISSLIENSKRNEFISIEEMNEI